MTEKYWVATRRLDENTLEIRDVCVGARGVIDLERKQAHIDNEWIDLTDEDIEVFLEMIDLISVSSTAA